MTVVRVIAPVLGFLYPVLALKAEAMDASEKEGQHHNHILHLLPGVMAEAAVQKISQNCWVFQTRHGG